MAKAKVVIELPPGAVLTDGGRAALVSAVKEKLGCCDEPHGEPHDLQKAEVRKLPHRAPQAWIEATGRLYAAQMEKMMADIEKVLTDDPSET